MACYLWLLLSAKQNGAGLLTACYTDLLAVVFSQAAGVASSAGETWRAGAELGVWTFLGFALQAIGLETTTATRCAFLLYLNVKFVPLFAFLIYGRSIPGSVWASAAAAVTGTFLLCRDGSAFNSGDAWSLAAAAASAMFILRLESHGKPQYFNAQHIADGATFVRVYERKHRQYVDYRSRAIKHVSCQF